MNRQDVFDGLLIADAASLGLHWMYEQDVIALVESSGDLLFRQPDSNVYHNRKGFFAHSGKLAGELSHYGESARIVSELAEQENYTPQTHQQRFLQVFGPCGSFRGYADKPTKSLIARIITDGDELPADSGMSDNQMPALCVVAPLFAAGHDADTTLAASRVISVHDDASAGTQALHSCLTHLEAGMALREALAQSAASIDHPLREKLQEALALESYQPLEAARHFGLACPVLQSLPVVWHLLHHARDFETLVRDNIRCGGDSCGRAMAAGAIAGYVFGIPSALRDRMQ